MKMMLSEYAQIAEIVGAFAIILSLIFVGYQLNNNAKATRSATNRHGASGFSGVLVTLGKSNPRQVPSAANVSSSVRARRSRAGSVADTNATTFSAVAR